MAFPTISTVLDDFNRADEGPPPSASWAGPILGQPFGIKVVSNTVKGNGAGASSGAWNATFGPDCEARISLVTASGIMGLYMRMSSPTSSSADGYHLRTDNVNNWLIYRIDNGTSTQLGSTVNGPATGTMLGAELIGDQIVMYHFISGAWSSTITRTDATYGAAGYIGLVGANTTFAYDDFIGGTVSGAALLVVQDAALALAADGPALTQHNLLVVADALLALAAEGVGLTQHNVLVVAEALLALAADGAVLTQHNIIAVADVLLALAAEAPVLTAHDPGAVVLVVQDAAIALGADSVILVVHLPIGPEPADSWRPPRDRTLVVVTRPPDMSVQQRLLRELEAKQARDRAEVAERLRIAQERSDAIAQARLTVDNERQRVIRELEIKEKRMSALAVANLAREKKRVEEAQREEARNVQRMDALKKANRARRGR